MLDPIDTQQKEDRAEPLMAPGLEALNGVRHAFFTRTGGVSEGIYDGLNCGFGSEDSKEHVAENRQRAAAALGLPSERLLTVFQIHSPDAVVVETPWSPEDSPRADAMVTAVPGLALGVLAADCGPVLFADPEAGVIGAAHAGWKGALTGVLESTLDAMESLGAKRSSVRAAVGPCIAQASYEVGQDFADRFTAEDPSNADFFRVPAGAERPHFDLSGYIARRLQAAGLQQHYVLGRDTYAEEELFYSYRRATHRGEPDYGRGLSAICLES